MSTEQAAISPVVSCDDVEVLLPMVADGMLDDVSDPTLFAHLSRCVSCQEALATHDLMQVALERSREPLSAVAASSTTLTMSKQAFSRWEHHRLPWPIALAASLCAAVGLWTWLNTMQGDRGQPQQAKTQVVPVLTEDGHAVYVVFDGDNVTVIDPRSIDGKSAPVRESTLPVKLSK
jgi:hypothetical protein